MRRTTETGGYGRYIEAYLWLRAFHDRSREQAGGARPPATLQTGISLENVTYRYPDTTRPALTDVTVYLPAGSVVAVVGEYGSGKTTLAKLLARFYTPDSGRITVDGTDLSAMSASAWRRVVSAVFQDFGRYQTIAREAVGLGSPHHMNDPDRFDRAVADAGADRLVARLPHGPDTELSAMFGGVELSEGQWQRIALARGCMRQQPLLFLLDEPTASLDAPSERSIFLRQLTRARAVCERTGGITIVVSHRFSTVVDADLILVLDGGRLLEVGTHSALMRNDGLYASAYRMHADAYAGTGYAHVGRPSANGDSHHDST